MLIRNEAESQKLAMYQQHIADLQEALPLAAEDKPSKRGHLSPMEQPEQVNAAMGRFLGQI